MRRIITVLAAAAALALAAPTAAQADGDPASDVLLLQDVYLPYAPGVPKPLRDTITELLKTTRKAGFKLKVAIVAKPQDLGAVPQYFGKPQEYAPFLQSEIAFNTKKPLLIVMPSGYGVAGMPAGAEKGIAGLKKPASDDGTELGRATVKAIVATAKAAGHPVPEPQLPKSGGSGGGTSPLVIFGVPVALLALGGLLAAVRRRQTPAAEA